MNANLKKVLVVDDDPVVGKSFDRVLTGKGYAVITALDGEEALAKLRSERYDVVYTDIRMPGIDGVEVARRIKAERPWLPVVIVTGYDTAENVERAQAAGVAGILRKPLSPEMIEASVENVAPVATAAPAAAAPIPAAGEGGIKWFGRLLAAPMLSLAVIIALPFIGIAVLAGMVARRLYEVPSARKAILGAKDVALFVGAPFIGLAYIVAGPFIGIAMLGRALLKRRAR